MPNCMENCSFKLHPVRRGAIGDGVKLELKGDFKGLKTCFSVNFLFESGIAYHFGVRLHENGHHEVFQGFKDDSPQWDELPPEVWSNDSEDVKKDLTIHLCGEEILVLVGGVQTRLKKFERKIPFEKISSIELWDDINWVEEINLRFNTQ